MTTTTVDGTTGTTGAVGTRKKRNTSGIVIGIAAIVLTAVFFVVLLALPVLTHNDGYWIHE